MTAFVSKPEYTQTLASAPGINSTPITELTLRPEVLWRRYDAATPNGPEKVGRSSFLSYLEQPCFRIQASKSCLCGPCEEHGWQNFEDLNALIKALHLGVDVERGFLARVQKLRDFLKHDYRRMCANALNTPTNPCSAWLCIPHGLSTLTEGAFSCPCPREHKMGPAECDEIDFLIADLSRVLEEKRQLAIGRAERSAAITKNATATGASSATALAAAAASCADAAAELNERSEELQGCAKHLDLYVRHLMRKALSHTITPKLLDALKERPARAHLIADYKAKPLPSGHRETQTAGFGKKGLSLHGVTALRWDERRGDFAVLNVRVTCDDSEQTWFHTLSALCTTMDQLTDTWKTLSGAAPLTAPLPLQSLPYLEEVTLQTDGANNYDCTAFMSSVKDVFTAVGLSARCTSPSPPSASSPPRSSRPSPGRSFSPAPSTPAATSVGRSSTSWFIGWRARRPPTQTSSSRSRRPASSRRTSRRKRPPTSSSPPPRPLARAPRRLRWTPRRGQSPPSLRTRRTSPPSTRR